MWALPALSECECRNPKPTSGGLRFEGPEATFVRSFAAFVMGLFNLAPWEPLRVLGV